MPRPIFGVLGSTVHELLGVLAKHGIPTKELLQLHGSTHEISIPLQPFPRAKRGGDWNGPWSPRFDEFLLFFWLEVVGKPTLQNLNYLENDQLYFYISITLLQGLAL